MREDKKDFGKFVIKLGQIERNALKLLCAKYDMIPSQVVTMALDDYYRRKLNGRLKEGLDDDGHCNQLIGELINSSLGIWGYDAEMNPVPDDKKHLLIESCYDEVTL